MIDYTTHMLPTMCKCIECMSQNELVLGDETDISSQCVTETYRGSMTSLNLCAARCACGSHGNARAHALSSREGLQPL